MNGILTHFAPLRNTIQSNPHVLHKQLRLMNVRVRSPLIFPGSTSHARTNLNRRLRVADRNLSSALSDRSTAVIGSPRASDAAAALSRLPSGLFILTACHEGKRSGQVVRSVQACAGEPMLVCVAAPTGHAIEPIIRDSHHFGLCLIDPGDALVLRQFGAGGRITADPFDCLPVEVMVSGAPIIKRSIAALDCEVVRHLDLEADHELYIGRVLAGRVYANDGKR